MQAFAGPMSSVNNFSHYLLGLLLLCSDQVKNNY
jgi:hypothetical protein